MTIKRISIEELFYPPDRDDRVPFGIVPYCYTEDNKEMWLLNDNLDCIRGQLDEGESLYHGIVRIADRLDRNLARAIADTITVNLNELGQVTNAHLWKLNGEYLCFIYINCDILIDDFNWYVTNELSNEQFGSYLGRYMDYFEMPVD